MNNQLIADVKKSLSILDKLIYISKKDVEIAENTEHKNEGDKDLYIKAQTSVLNNFILIRKTLEKLTNESN